MFHYSCMSEKGFIQHWHIYFFTLASTKTKNLLNCEEKDKKIVGKVAIKRFSLCFHHTKRPDYFYKTSVPNTLKISYFFAIIQSFCHSMFCLFVWFWFIFSFSFCFYFQIFSKVNINSTISSSIVKLLLCSKINKFDCILVHSYVWAISLWTKLKSLYLFVRGRNVEEK